ncbi:PPR2 [Psilocybe cyanescens]|uniref:PPR2 n=1 Tax=Psilocybe cyanescens TaxID=93625 RepID=A0A409WXL4_PSICY|nr:PPR2 [Psilocybe cyanescens]
MSYAASALPPALLDLTLLRVAGASPRISSSVGRALRWKRAFGRRALHHEASSGSASSPDFQELMDQGFSIPKKIKLHRTPSDTVSITEVNGSSSQGKSSLHPIQELEKRVKALEDAVESEQMAVQPFFYAEEDLMAMYQDVLSVPELEASGSSDKASKEGGEKAISELQIQEDLVILGELERRLCTTEEGEMETNERQNEPVYRRILIRAQEIVSRADAARRNANPEAARQPLVPIGILSAREYETLVRASLKAKDYIAGEVALDIVKTAGLPIPEEVLTSILNMYVATRNPEAADKLLANFLTETPTEAQRDLHIRAHVNATPKTVLPTSALDLLHHYEEQNAVAPMSTYTSIISSLLSRPLSLARAHAWDIFSHMRYVAHPDPDVDLYTLMIEACATPVSVAYSSEPEKALDLWTEMTADHNISPTVASYNAVILACARSGEKSYVNEAFRLARRMLDTHRDARGLSAFRPDLKTFCALLEGSKRIGDLARARWILAEMVRGRSEDEVNSVDVEINDEVMMHMFHTYAAYKPPIIRTKIVSVADGKASKVGTSDQLSPIPSSSSSTEEDIRQSDNNVSEVIQASYDTQEGASGERIIAKEESAPSSSAFPRVPPQSHAEVIREVRMLLDAILRDRNSVSSLSSLSEPSSSSSKKFRDVELSPRLVGSYLSVFYNHASLEKSREVFATIFDRLGVTCTPRLYVEALERCAIARRGPERTVAVAFSDEVWEQWSALEDTVRYNGRPLEARFVERANVARVRMLAITDNLSRSMAQLKAFAAKYPPEVIKTPPPKLPLQSTRTALVGHRPLVRMTPKIEVPDDAVPPLITFRDIDVLHHRLIIEERVKDIAYITWLCKSYEWALRIRRDKANKSRILKV